MGLILPMPHYLQQENCWRSFKNRFYFNFNFRIFVSSFIKDTIVMKNKKSNMLHLPILVEIDEDNIYIVSCPVFKGCHSYGKTIDEALNNITEVIQMCIEEGKDNQPKLLNRFIGFRELQFPFNAASL